MDSRVILNRARRREAVTLQELEDLKGLQPVLRADGVVQRTSRVSVIVPTFFNTGLKSGSLRHLLAGIEAARSVEQVVLVASDVEGQSFDSLRQIIGERSLVMARAEPHNRGASRNAGAGAATGEYLLFLDDDMLLKNWRCVDVVLSALLTGGFECAMFPRRQYARFPLLYDPPSLEAAVGRWRQHGVNGDPLVYDPLYEGTPDLPMLFCFPGCFMLIHRAAFTSLAGFNNSFQGWGFEDTEFALRAIRQLRVLNLFSKAEPLLHIDHPVSPYKSDEHQVNYQKYFASAVAVDVHRFCRTVLLCSDFIPEGDASPLLQRNIHTEPFAGMAAAGVPLDPREIEEWAAGVAEKRLHALLSPRPEFIVLHGSRATGRARHESDYDVLALYTGAIQEFFVSATTPRVEIECAELDIFSAISEQPWSFGLSGVLELAKIANARLLWGQPPRWVAWREHTLTDAAAHGHLYWRVLCLGLKAQSSKYGELLPRFVGSLRVVLTAGGLPEPAEELAEFVGSTFRRRTVTLLDKTIPEWRVLLAGGRNVFPLQIPEIWSALYMLAATPTVVPRAGAAATATPTP